MKKLPIILIFLITILSCKNEPEPIDDYFIQFDLKTGVRTDQIRTTDGGIRLVSGWVSGINDFGESTVYVGGSFVNPIDNSTVQSILIGLTQEIPAKEFEQTTYGYEFKNPSIVRNYFLSGGEIDPTGFFHENVETFCTAQISGQSANYFKVTEMHYYVDEQGYNAVDIRGAFGMTFISFCQNSSIEIANGRFHVKRYINKAP